MQYTAPHYYKRFKCIADKCPDTCCAGWQIMIDNKTYHKYKSLKGDTGKWIRGEINKKEQCFKQYDKRCAFLNNDNLCDLVLEGGDELLCRTCRMFPREIEEYDGLREISLSLSCPVITDMLMSMEEKVTFIHREGGNDPEPDEDFDFILFTKLEDARDLMFRILQNRDYPISVRMAIVLSLAHDMEERTKRNCVFEIDNLFDRYEGDNVYKWFSLWTKELKENNKDNYVLRDLFDIIDNIEVLKKTWPAYIKDIEHTLFNSDLKADKKAEKIWLKSMEIPMEQLCIYFMYKYFAPAVYDDKIYVRTKFALLSAVVIREMTRAILTKQKILCNKENLEAFKDCCFAILTDAARQYSKEIEHSDENLDLLKTALEDEVRFGMDDILSIL